MSEDNKAMVHRMVKAINADDMDVMDELFVPKLARPTKRSFTAFRAAFPDWRMEIAELVAEGTTVVGRFRCSGTNRGEFKGVPPTGKRMEVDEVYFLRVEDGKFVDFWALEDDLARMRQLGLIPSPEQPEKACST
ncbi:MAG: ester cyclase [Actinobacteria bacterium]|nr:ester cyclase [Actinomycetota bacterium]